MVLTNPPNPDVCEVSLFGTGRGEAIALHVQGGDWILVDSCIDRTTGEVATLTYLNSIGVDAAKGVRLVVATHAHDDHVGGMAKTVATCSSADFVCPAAATEEEFFALLQLDEELEARGLRPSALREYRSINELLEGRSSKATGSPAYKWAIADRLLYQKSAESGSPEVRVIALSPSDEAVTRAKQAMASWFPADGEQPRRLRQDPNTMSVALWVEVGEVRILLGSDLLVGPGPRCGWNAVLASTTRPRGKASVYKVSHHGSPGADHPDVWKSLLVADPFALLTPYWPGRTPLPSKDDVRRICSRTKNAYIAASPRVPTQPRAVGTIAGSLTGIARTVRGVRGRLGHVRVRINLTDRTPKWSAAVEPPAQKLCKAAKKKRPRRKGH